MEGLQCKIIRPIKGVNKNLSGKVEKNKEIFEYLRVIKRKLFKHAGATQLYLHAKPNHQDHNSSRWNRLDIKMYGEYNQVASQMFEGRLEQNIELYQKAQHKHFYRDEDNGL